jgi:PAS domain S-box-containing protein
MTRNLKILFAEDNPADAELVMRQLRRDGFTVEVEYVETEEAFAAGVQKDVDLVLSDYDLGSFNGFRALEILLERGLDIPFILISGTIGEDLAVQAIKRGASDYLLKDRLARLGTAVTHALEEGRLRRERSKTEASLRLFRALMDQSDDTFEIIDPHTGRFLDVSEKSCTVLGYTREEHLNLFVADIDPFIRSYGWAKVAAETQALGSCCGAGMHQRKDGSTFPIEFSARWVRLDRDYIVSVVRDISERKQVEKKLRERERSLAMAQTVAHLGSWELDLVDLDDMTRNPLRWSDELFRVFGYKPGAINVSNASFYSHVHPDDRGKVRKAIKEALRTGETYNIDHRIIRPDGVERIIHECADIVRDETGRPVTMVGTAQDVTERRRMDIALRESREDFRKLFDANPMPMWVYDRETLRFLAVNEAAIHHYGYDCEEFLGMTIKELLAPEDVPTLLEVVSKDRPPGQPPRTWRHLKKNGEAIYMEINFHAFTFQGRPAGLILANDITVQRQNVLALRESEERFRQLAENINEVFWMTDPTRKTVLYVSPAYETICGRSCESLCRAPETWEEMLHPDDRARVMEAVSRQAAGGYHEIFRIVRPDGSLRWVRDRAFPIKDAEGHVYRIVGTTEDITERRKLEDQFRQAQKLEAIGTLAGGIAHDFNNILGAIIGYAELTKMDLRENTTPHQYIDMVLQGAHRAAALVRQILAFSRQQEQQRVPVQLKQVVEEPLNLLRATIPAIIEFDVSLASDLPVVRADPTQVHQMVMNLCTNAAHAMRDRPGKLGVKLEKFWLGTRRPGIETHLKPGLYVRLTVSDTGCGMQRNTLERIFEPFFTTKGPGEGTGLGLSVVHGIMQSHEGAVTVQSQPGQGSAFHLYFPADNNALPKNQVPETAKIPRGTGQRILFVEDELPIANVGESILKAFNYQTTSVTDAIEALELVRADPMAFDLVITDLSMPRMMGTDLAAEILAIRPDLPIILTTGFTTKLTVDIVHAMGIRELLLKPFSFQSLGSAVHEALSQPGGILGKTLSES